MSFKSLRKYTRSDTYIGLVTPVELSWELSQLRLKGMKILSVRTAFQDREELREVVFRPIATLAEVRENLAAQSGQMELF